MKDNFSTQAKSYVKFRPGYPQEMVDFILSNVTTKIQALDVATGNGQLAIALSPHFQAVFASDISDQQLEHATRSANIFYKKMPAEDTDFDDNQFDLITVAQAVHWFDFDKFYKEARRILKPQGIIAIIGYGLFSTNPESHLILSDFYHNIVGPYWDVERKYLDEMYQTIPFPFDEIKSPQFQNHEKWSIEQLIGYLNTWSAVQHYKDKNGSNPVTLIESQLRESWENSDKNVTFPMLLRSGRINK